MRVLKILFLYQLLLLFQSEVYTQLERCEDLSPLCPYRIEFDSDLCRQVIYRGLCNETCGFCEDSTPTPVYSSNLISSTSSQTTAALITNADLTSTPCRDVSFLCCKWKSINQHFCQTKSKRERCNKTCGVCTPNNIPFICPISTTTIPPVPSNSPKNKAITTNSTESSTTQTSVTTSRLTTAKTTASKSLGIKTVAKGEEETDNLVISITVPLAVAVFLLIAVISILLIIRRKRLRKRKSETTPNGQPVVEDFTELSTTVQVDTNGILGRPLPSTDGGGYINIDVAHVDRTTSSEATHGYYNVVAVDTDEENGGAYMDMSQVTRPVPKERESKVERDEGKPAPQSNNREYQKLQPRTVSHEYAKLTKT